MAATPDEIALADPFFGELRRRHPDVTLVLLPPLDSRPPEQITATEEARGWIPRVRAGVDLLEMAVPLDWQRARELWWRSGDRGAHRFVIGAVSAGSTPHCRCCGTWCR